MMGHGTCSILLIVSMIERYANHISNKETPQDEPIPGSGQSENNAGGYAWRVDKWQQLDRFLILGTVGGTFYVGERALTIRNAEAIRECIAEDASRVLQRTIDVSHEGRAFKNDPAIMLMALLLTEAPVEVRQRTRQRLSEVCRTATHLFKFAECCKSLRGWGRGLKRAVQDWYGGRSVQEVAYQAIKYRQREGWTHRDLLRLSKPDLGDPNSVNGDRIALYRWMVGKIPPQEVPNSGLPDRVKAFERVQAASSADEVCDLIQDHSLPREAIPSEYLNDPKVWEALVADMPMTALLRNLAKLGDLGMLKPFDGRTKRLADQLEDPVNIRVSRLHPLSILMALRAYENHGGGERIMRGKVSDYPISTEITGALERAFYRAFQNVKPSGKRFLIALDVSGSMTMNLAATGMSCCEAAAALSMVTVSLEEQTHVMGFGTEFVELGFRPEISLSEATRTAQWSNFGRTDCALPAIYAYQHGLHVDGFVILTDNETWAGSVHPSQALDRYRRKINPDAKQVVVGMTANRFSIASPSDTKSIDVVGFDASVPRLISDFVGGRI